MLQTGRLPRLPYIGNTRRRSNRRIKPPPVFVLELTENSAIRIEGKDLAAYDLFNGMLITLPPERRQYEISHIRPLDRRDWDMIAAFPETIAKQHIAQ